MTASTLSRGIDVRVGNDCRFDSSYEQWNAVRSKHGGESDAALQSTQRSAFLGAGICLLLAGLTTGCDIAVARDETGVVEKALVPPPPVNQNIGMYDRTFNRMVASDCLGCHDPTTTDPTAVSGVVARRHHLLLDPSSPRYKGRFTSCIVASCDTECCHPPGGTAAVSTIPVDCRMCHTSAPHHKSAPAQARHCSACHGSVVNNFDDGHYVPTYKKSIVTPAPDCRVWTNASHTTCNAGGCRACHVASTAVTPNTWNNDQTHHGTGLGQGGAGSANPPEQCGWCHNISTVGGVPAPAIDIRTCETCHGPTSLHAIEYQYNKNKGNAGFGHVGAEWDCWGCHGFFGKSDLPLGPIVPTSDSCNPSELVAGVPTTVCCTGQSFTNTILGENIVKVYSPMIVVSVLDEIRTEGAFQVITPTSFTESEICFTATLPAGVYNVRIVKDYLGQLEVRSNGIPLVVEQRSQCSQACVDPVQHVVRVTCMGFGCPGSVFVMHGLSMEQCAVSSCSNTTIVAYCANAAVGDKLAIAGGGLPVSATLEACP